MKNRTALAIAFAAAGLGASWLAFRRPSPAVEDARASLLDARRGLDASRRDLEAGARRRDAVTRALEAARVERASAKSTRDETMREFRGSLEATDDRIRGDLDAIARIGQEIERAREERANTASRIDRSRVDAISEGIDRRWLDLQTRLESERDDARELEKRAERAERRAIDETRRRIQKGAHP